MKLTKEEIQQIIKEELEALQEIGDLSGVERDKDLTAMGQKQQAAFDAASSDADKLIAAGESYMMPSDGKFKNNKAMQNYPMTDRQWKDFFIAGLETVYLVTLELTMEAFGEFLDKSLVQAELLEAAKVIAKYLEAGKGMQTKADFDKLYNDPRFNRQYLAALSLMLRIADANFGSPVVMLSSYVGSALKASNAGEGIQIEKNPEGVNGKAVSRVTASKMEDAFQDRIRRLAGKMKADYLKHLEKYGSFGFAFDDDEKDAVPKQLAKMGIEESLKRLKIKEMQVLENFDQKLQKSNLSLTKSELQRIIQEELENIIKGN